MTAAVAALVTERGGSVVLSDVTVRSPRGREVLVRVMASGICPTDLYGIDGGAGNRFPSVFGHEGAGVVEAVGDRVTSLLPGDRVALSFDSCGDCAGCGDGHPAYCERFAELNYARRTDAITGGDGPVTTGWMAQSAWSTHVLVHDTNAVALDPDVPWDVAATLGCGVLTGVGTVLNVLRPRPDDVLLVLGAGTTGLAAVMAAHHRGVGHIVVSEPNASRRGLARELGATAAYDPAETAEALAAHPAVSHIIDTVGTQATLDLALGALAPRGVCVTVALRRDANDLTVSQSRLLWGRTLQGAIEGDADIARDIPLLVALWRIGSLPIERLITAYRFDAIASAIDDSRAGTVIKPVLMMDDAGASAPRAAGSLLDALRAGTVAADALPALWRSNSPVSPCELRGLWRGWGVTPTHRMQHHLERSRWFGKLFRSDDNVAPIIREGDAGGLFIDRAMARGGATLRTAMHDGIATAAMIYDGQPVIDLFTRIGPGAVLGVMTGRGTADAGRLYYFVLERVADPDVPIADAPPGAAA